MSTKYPSAERIRNLLIYEPATGHFYWRERGKGRRVDRPAGSVSVNGYVVLNIDYKGPLLAHRLAWLYEYGSLPTTGIDHRNGVRSDNRILNLRAATETLNGQNRRRANKNSRTGVLGAHKHTENSYRSRIKVGPTNIYLGVFKSAEEANLAYVAAKRELHEGCTI